MKLTKTSESRDTVTVQSVSSQVQIYGALEVLVSNFKKMNPLYFFTHPEFLFRKIDYAGFSLRSNHVYINRSVTTPPIFIYFEIQPGGNTLLLFKASYLRIFRWVFFGSIPVLGYFMYLTIQSDYPKATLLLMLGIYVFTLVVLALLAWGTEKWNSYFFKRDVDLIINELNEKLSE
jgi:hypothetical protein